VCVLVCVDIGHVCRHMRICHGNVTEGGVSVFVRKYPVDVPHCTPLGVGGDNEKK